MKVENEPGKTANIKFKKLEDIVTWQKAKVLAVDVYKLTSQKSFERDYSIKDQMRRSGVSVPSNIAEGFGRGGSKEFKQFLSISKGSLYELKTQVYIAHEIGYCDVDVLNSFIQKIEELAGLVSGLIRYLKTTEVKGSKFSKN